MRMSGSQIVVRCLQQQGVDTVFGYPGGQIMPLYDALYDSPIRHVLTVHEQGAAHAADGYARATSRVGVCIATSGPGATNLVTGLATAFMDSSPVVAITGQVPTTLLGRDSFQEVDITGITMPITKHSFLVRDISTLADTIHQAFIIAASGRPGPVLVDIPRDILQTQFAFDAPAKPHDSLYSPKPVPPTDESVKTAAQALLAAQRPVMIAGGGIISSQTHTQALSLSQAYRLPVLSTLMGLGAFPHDHPCYLGLTGMHGHKAANYAVHEADVILAVGTRFSDRVTGNPGKYAAGKTVIHLDVDPAEMGKNIPAHISVTGDLQKSLQALIELLKAQPPTDFTEWWSQIANWQQTYPSHTNDKTLTAQWIMQHISQAPSAQPKIWVTDVGQHQMWSAQHLQITEPRSWITSGGLGTMGFGLPAALGAQAACPEKRVVLIAGDGGFKMTGMELFTAVNEKLPVICVIINNGCLGMVRQWQQLFYNERYASSLLPEFDFAAFTNSCGAAAFTASTQEEFATAFAQSLTSSLPSVIVANIDQSLLVKPMVSPGAPINQFLDI